MHMYLPSTLNLISRENGWYTSLIYQILVILYFDHCDQEKLSFLHQALLANFADLAIGI